MAKAVKQKMQHAKETKGTHQYKADGDDPKLQTVYIPKKTLKEMGDEQPDEILVSLSIVE